MYQPQGSTRLNRVKTSSNGEEKWRRTGKWKRLLAVFCAAALFASNLGTNAVSVYAEDGVASEAPAAAESAAAEPAAEPATEPEAVEEPAADPVVEDVPVEEQTSDDKKETTEDASKEESAASDISKTEESEEASSAASTVEDADAETDAEARELKITYKADPSDGGKVAIGDAKASESQDETVDLKAETVSAKGATASNNEGYEFVNWTDKDGNEVSTDLTYSPAVSADSEAGEATYTANFKATEVAPEEPEAEKKELKLTYTAGEGGTVTTSDETIDLNAEDKTVKGSTATANEGYEFVNWTTSDGTEISTSAEFVPEISDATEAGEKSYKANFKLTEVVKEKNLEISYKASKGGSVSSDKETIDLNADKITVKGSTATADEGYEFVNWTDVDGKEVSTDAKLVPSASADMEAGSVSYTANFKETKKENEIIITYKAADGGSVSSKDEKVDLATDKIAVKGSTAAADDGYKFKNWTDADGKEVSTDEKYVPEVTAPAEGEEAKDLVYTANFEVNMPAKVFYGTASNGVTVRAAVDEGTFPAGTSMDVAPVSADEVITAAQGTVDGEVVDVKAVNITFTDADGKEIQPANDNRVRVTISMASSDAVEGDEYSVVHIEDNGSADKVADAGSTSAHFEAKSFSIYAIVGTGEKGKTARRTYNFYNGSVLVDTQVIKSGDTLVEPKIPTDGDGHAFLGWSTEDSKTYQDFGVITDESIIEGETVTLYARFDALYYVYFLNKEGTVIATKSGEEKDSIDTTDVKFIVDAEESITGWSLTDSKGTQTSVGDSVTLENNDITLYPIVESGHWLTFDTKGGSVISPVFCSANETTSAPANPSKAGYVFDGWYSDAEGSEVYSFGGTLSENKTVYAKWDANTNTQYKLIYWIENANDTNYTFEAVKTATGTTDANVKLSNSQQSVDNIAESYKQFFTYKENDASGKTINADGSTVVNVYFSRNEYTVTFNLVETYGLYNYSEDMTVNGTTYTSTSAISYSITAKYDSDIESVWPTASNFESGNTFYGWDIGASSLAVSKRLTMVGDLCVDGGKTAKASYGTTCLDHLYYMFESLDQNADESGNTRKKYNGVYYDMSSEYSQDANSQGGGWVQKDISGMNAVGVSTVVLKSESKGHDKKPTERNVFLYYTRLSYNLTFVPNDGNSIADSIIKLGTSLSGSVPSNYVIGVTTKTVSGQVYTFTGWYNNTECAGEPVDFASVTMPANNVSYYGGWKAATYTVKIYNTDPLNKSTDKTDLSYGDTSINEEYLDSLVSLCSGEEIRGWYYVENGKRTNKLYQVGTPVTSSFAIAPYIVNATGKYTVTYVLPEGAAGTVPTDSNTYGVDAKAKVLPATGITAPEGKVFLGWTDGTSTYTPYSTITIKGSVTLTAKFGDTVGTTSLTYNANTGADSATVKHSVDGKTTFNNNTTLTLYGATTFTRTGYTLIGWATSSSATSAEFALGQKVGADETGNTLYAVWKQNLSVTLTAKSGGGVYQGSAYSVSGYTSNVEGVTFDGISVPEVSRTNVGATDVVFAAGSPAVATGSDGNTYDVTYAPGTLTVKPVAITVTADNKEKVYGAADPKLTAQITSGAMVGLDTLDYSLSRTAGETTGTYQITVSGEATQGNYTVTYVPGTLTIKANSEAIVVTAGIAEKQYDGEALTQSDASQTTYTGTLVNGDTLVATTSGTITNVGTEDNKVTAVVIKNAAGDDVTANYSGITTVNGTLTVTKRPVTLTSGSASKTYDGGALTNGTITVSGDGFVDGEGATYSVTGSQTSVGSSSNTFTYSVYRQAAPYAMTRSAFVPEDNYNITVVYGTLTVTSAGGGDDGGNDDTTTTEVTTVSASVPPVSNSTVPTVGEPITVAEATPPVAASTVAGSVNGRAAATGDDSNMNAYGGIATTGVIGLFAWVVAFLKRKKREDEV